MRKFWDWLQIISQGRYQENNLVGGRELFKRELLKGIEKARQDWYYAADYFNCVTDPDLIDYAIYNLDASEQKYNYLLKKAREFGLTNKSIPTF